MAGLLDGDLQAVFGSVFSPLLLDATLHKATITEDGSGGWSSGFADNAVKAMEKKHSAVYRAKAGIPSKDINVIVMQHGSGLSEIDTEDEITIRGVRYAIKAPIDQDSAQAAWDFWATPKAEPA
ncbi:hypothetical protein [Marinicauda sp. Alg238-R41]|uniref:hypothetical protein n=1 Tax=Marinicauda sp. Alg238-R41 TaxID=2993447 RepID=UPI0022E7CF0D|nr:hypothetical protein [Marinicauda sp. Alg238-R41]